MPKNQAPGELDRQVASLRREYEAALRRLVEIPTISMDPARKPDVLRGAEAAADAVRTCGGRARVLPTKGNPIVVGRFDSDPAHPTVTIYNHLDVQPADEPEWTREPFKLVIDGDRYFARGATDDKGPALATLFAARHARQSGVPINVQFLWELEEEIGSPSLDGFLRQQAAELATDSIVVSDTVWLAPGKPAVSSGLRGLQGATMRLRTGAQDVHSGLTGGAARNPIAELAAVIDALHDPKTGRIKIKGFYDDVIRPTKAELASFARSGFSVKGFKQAHHLESLRHRAPLDVMRAIWTDPTFEVHGISGGYQGPGIKTVVPQVAEAKVSFRLVPNQTPAKAFKLLQAAVRKLNPDVVVKAESALAPFRGETTGPFAEAANDAIRFGFGFEPALVREGGSIGAVVTMQKHLRCPITFIGLSLPEHGYHAPNEFFDWVQASGGIKTFVRYLELLSRAPRGKRRR